MASIRYFLVMDLEATCERDDRMWANEIIEFPAVLLDAINLEVVEEFCEFVRPTEKPTLTAFCTELTSIAQSDVANAATLDIVMQRFNSWLESRDLLNNVSSVLPVTCGDWDLKKMLPNECSRKGLVAPPVLSWWCNIKNVFQAVCGKAGGMAQMLSKLNIKHTGRHHRGIDDSRNIAKILIKLIRTYNAAIVPTSGGCPPRSVTLFPEYRDEFGSSARANESQIVASAEYLQDDRAPDRLEAQRSKITARRWGKNSSSAGESATSQVEHCFEVSLPPSSSDTQLIKGEARCERQNVSIHSKGKGKGRNKGAETGSSRKGPEFDPWTPCGYFLAGHCRYGSHCAQQHSIPYCMAVRDDWLNPGQTASQELLKVAAVSTCGSEAVKKACLFPRVFSSVLDTSTGGCPSGAGRKSRQSRSAPRNSTDFSQQGALRFLLILDLEGKEEIIEFPVIAFDAFVGREIGRFQRYVRPVRLFDGCPCSPDSPAVPFTAVLEDFDKWLQETLGCALANLRDDVAFLTCGDWDCKHVHSQCNISGIRTPRAFSRWVNIKRTYQGIYGKEFRGMRSMLAMLGLLDSTGHVIVGFHHLGMHDVENIGRCLLHLVNEGHAISINGGW